MKIGTVPKSEIIYLMSVLFVGLILNIGEVNAQGWGESHVVSEPTSVEKMQIFVSYCLGGIALAGWLLLIGGLILYLLSAKHVKNREKAKGMVKYGLILTIMTVTFYTLITESSGPPLSN